MNEPLTPIPRPLAMRALLAIVVAALAAVLCLYAYLSLQWPMMREGHFLHYMAYLVNEHGFAPYRDVLETSWFGTVLFHSAIGQLFGYTSSGFRQADLLYLAALLLVTWRILNRFDHWLAWVGTLSTGLMYLHYGPANSLQRDYVLVLPITLSLLISLQSPWRSNTRALLIGACFGAVVSIKPHAIIGLPVVLGLLYSQSKEGRSAWQIIGCCGIGGTAVFAAGLLWLWWRGGLAAFIDMTLHYLPLYQSFNGAHQITTPTERWQSTVFWWRYFLWIWPYSVAIGLLHAWFNSDNPSTQRPLILAIAGLAVCFNLYPLIAGKFWDYHWIPYSFFSVLGTSLLLAPLRRQGWGNQLLSCALLCYFIYALGSQYAPWIGYRDQIRRWPDIGVDQKFDGEVAQFIRQNLPPGEKIQIIEQGGPATLYLLQAEAVLATPYLGSFMFLHHTEQPYVQHAQQDFLQRLATKPPALFLVMTDFTRPSGPGTITEIPGLKPFLQQHYAVIWQHQAFAFWQRKPSAAESPAAPIPAPHSVPVSPP